MKKISKIIDNSLLFVMLFLLIYYLIIAYNIKLNRSPDELLRYKIPLYIFNHGQLPIGTNKEVMLPFGNYSYAYYPQLLGGIISAGFMKIFSLFTANSRFLIFAARLTSVFFGLVAVYFTALSTKMITNSKKWATIAGLLAGMLPQFSYLSAYVNNDIIAIAGVSIILYSVISASQNKWNYKNALIFAIGVVICLLGYLNSIPFVLFGGIYAIYTLVVQIKRQIVDKRKGLYIVISALLVIFLLAFPFYLRNYYLYHDFMGNQAFIHAYNHWIAGGGRPTMHPFQKSMFVMLLKSDWLKTTYKSMIGMFGYYEYFLGSACYIFYLLFFYTGFLFEFFNERANTWKNNLNILLIFSVIFTVLLSAYRSQTTDYQPQGRYILTILPVLLIWCVEGFKWLSKKANGKERKLLYGSIGLYTLISFVSILHYVILNPMMVY